MPTSLRIPTRAVPSQRTRKEHVRRHVRSRLRSRRGASTRTERFVSGCLSGRTLTRVRDATCTTIDEEAALTRAAGANRLAKLYGGRHADRSPGRASTEQAHGESDPRVLGRMGRLGARRHGRVDLRRGARPGARRPAAPLGYRRDAGQRRLLRQRSARAVPVRMGTVDGLGTGGRSLRPRPRADADDPLLLAVHVPVRAGDEHLAARRAARVVRHRHRRRAADRRHIRRRGVARGSAQDGRRLHAHRLLLRILPRRARELFHRRELRLAVDVCARRRAGAARQLDPARRPRVGRVAAEPGRRRARPEDERSVPEAVLA